MLRAFVSTALGGLVLCASCTLIGEGALDGKPSETATSNGGSDVGKSCLLPEECSTRVCRDGLCATCGSDKDCQPLTNSYCDGARCAPKLEDGEVCSQSQACLSGSCSDGVCCDRTCDDACHACSEALTGEADGQCAAVLPGTNPDEECGTGFCNDSGQCCGERAEPIGGDCPGVCNGGCANNICVVNVDNTGLANTTFDCPAGFACEINCFGQSSCANSDINCPAGGESCRVQCLCSGNDINCCYNTQLYCNNGPCMMECGEAPSGCVNAEVICSSNQCAATCDGDSMPTVYCNSSCDCTSC